jgi:hypothetical protein
VYFVDLLWGEKPRSGKLYVYDFATRQVRIVARTNGIPVSLNSGLALFADERVAYFVQVDHWGRSIYPAEGVAW